MRPSHNGAIILARISHPQLQNVIYNYNDSFHFPAFSGGIFFGGSTNKNACEGNAGALTWLSTGCARMIIAPIL
ncbi:hypothetical protein FIA64_10970 [Escherichia coli]|nr:hypothetical protein [Escherichia coli]